MKVTKKVNEKIPLDRLNSLEVGSRCYLFTANIIYCFSVEGQLIKHALGGGVNDLQIHETICVRAF